MARRRGREERMGGVSHSFVVLPTDKKTGQDVDNEVENRGPEIKSYVTVTQLVREASIFAGMGLVGVFFLGVSLSTALAPLVFVLLFVFIGDNRHYFKED